jgi:hypothetical protein
MTGRRGTLRGLRKRRPPLVLPHAEKATTCPRPKVSRGTASEKPKLCGVDAKGQAPAFGRGRCTHRCRGRNPGTVATLGAARSARDFRVRCASNLCRQPGLR